MSTKKDKLYFASDFHLGVPNHEESLIREKRIVRWLDEIKNDAKEIYLVGDIFDFWFEYKSVVPKGFVRLQGKIAELVDEGIPIHFFTGNHDMWMFTYFQKELGIQLHRSPITIEHDGKLFYIGHGDGLGPGDKGYKFLKKIFANRFFQWCFARIHPNLGIGIANYSSRKSRAKTGNSDEVFLGEEGEWLIQYCKEILQHKKVNYFVFGHRHLPLNIKLTSDSKYINLGEWINYSTYAVYENGDLKLKSFPSNQSYENHVNA